MALHTAPKSWFSAQCPKPKSNPILSDIVGLEFNEHSLASLSYLSGNSSTEVIKLARALHSALYRGIEDKYVGYLVLDLASRLPSPDDPSGTRLFAPLKSGTPFPTYPVEHFIDPSVQDTLVTVKQTTVSFLRGIKSRQSDITVTGAEEKSESSKKSENSEAPAVGGEYERSAMFCAAFLLRALVKNSDSIVASWVTLGDRYQSFFQADFHPVFTKVPTPEHVEAIKKKITATPLIAVSWVKLFVELEAKLNQRSTSFRMLRYLCFLPLSWAGMHAFKLFANYIVKLRADGYWLLEQLMLPEHWPGVKMMYSIMVNQLPQEGVSIKKAPYYKYARLLDSAFYSDLQTSNCLSLTYVLAKLNAIECPMGPNADPMKIRLLENISPEAKSFLDDMATQVVLLRPTSQYEMYSEAGKRALENKGAKMEAPAPAAKGVSFLSSIKKRNQGN